MSDKAHFGTQHGRDKNDPNYYTTNSQIPHLPFISGFFGTAETYRFLVVSTQTATIIGEPKYGLWRVQENGYIREYRKKAKNGLPPGVDPNSAITLQDNGYKQTITHNYAYHLPGEGESGYKHPDQNVSDGSDGVKGHANFVDLSIYHLKYGGKYNDHVPIDLPFFYSMTSGPHFEHVKKVWGYIISQPNTNKIGPLGIRAGLDIKENFQNVLRMHQFDDAGIWVNVGSTDPFKDNKIHNREEAKYRVQSADYQRIDLSKVEHEIYFFERLMFNTPYLYIGLILANDNVTDQSQQQFSFIRPHGAYYNETNKRHDLSNIPKRENYDIDIVVENYPSKGSSSVKTAKGLPLYGMHHPNRRAREMDGGACPEKGGDISRYPWGNPGSGWPTNYEEVTTICDAFAIDLKLWANLDKSWEDPALYIGSTGYKGKTKVEYVLDANKYGTFEDPYLRYRVNPHAVNFSITGKHVSDMEDPKPEPIKLNIDFTRAGKKLDFNNVSEIHEVNVERTQQGRDKNEPNYYPFITGFVGTAGTYRFLVVSTQTATIIGEPKHGLWRVQENGYIREYRIKAKNGLPPGVDPNSKITLKDNGYKQTIIHNYAHHLPCEGESGYKHPDQNVSDGSDGVKGHANFVDLSIYHPKYGGNYYDHVPIDLPFFYCMTTGPGFEHLKKVWEYMMSQPNTNKIGPLGIRAGLDIKENFQNVLRMHQFDDAGIWVNVGSANPGKNNKTHNRKEAEDRVQSADYQRIDLSKVEHEIYFFERLMFNTPYLYIGLILANDNVTDQSQQQFSFIRPHGAYYNEANKRQDPSKIPKKENYDIKVSVENYPSKGSSTIQTAKGLPLYGMHHPNRRAREMDGGACPEKGGDISRYPWGNPGSGWPTNYEEVTTICDAFAIDLKLWANLDKSWEDPALYIGSTGYKGKTKVEYVLDANIYGTFEDPYLRYRVNPHAVNFSITAEHVSHMEDPKPEPIKLNIDFTRAGKKLDFNNVPEIHKNGQSIVVAKKVVSVFCFVCFCTCLMFM